MPLALLPRRAPGPLALAALALLAPAAAFAQPNPPAGGPQITAVLAADAPKIDGVLDDAVWATAAPVSDFRQRTPVDLGEPSERTELRVAYDRHHLYVAVTLFDREPEKIRANIYERGGRIDKDDNVHLVLDTYLDRKNAYVFEMNPLGTQDDALLTDESALNWDWDGVYRSEARITDQGWALEVAIPFTTIRFAEGDAPVMGIAVRRTINRKNEDVVWPGIARRYRMGHFQVSQFAVLTGLRGIERGRGVEVKPYVLAGAQRTDPATGPSRTDLVRDAGLDVKWSLTNSLLLDLTLNTDFAQVEADEAQVNLTRFNLFFPEKREFFLERGGLFTFGSPGETETFFSRRIGLANPILGGARLTGEVGPVSVGALNLQTREKAGVDGANYTVVRAQTDVLPRTTVGGIVTNVEADSVFNRAAGVDGVARFWGNSSVAGWFTQVWATGERAALSRAGQASVSLQADEYGVFGRYTNVGRRFDPGVGFVARQDFVRYDGEAGYRPVLGDGTGAVRRLSFVGYGSTYVGQDGRRQTTEAEASAQVQFRARDRVTVSAGQTFERLDGPFPLRSVTFPAGRYTFRSAGLSAQTDESRRVFARAGVSAGGFYDGTSRGVNGALGVRVSKHLKFETTGRLTRVERGEAGFDAVTLGLRVEAAANRDLFARALVQYDNFSTLLRANVRLNWIHTPGSDLFVVFNTGYRFDPEGRFGVGDLFNPEAFALAERTGVVKLTYLKAL